jgi:DnaJ-class molecular chaperone
MCDACFGSCPICAPDVVTECETCQGTGKVMVHYDDCDEWHHDICEDCKGEGYIPIEN